MLFISYSLDIYIQVKVQVSFTLYACSFLMITSVFRYPLHVIGVMRMVRTVSLNQNSILWLCQHTDLPLPDFNLLFMQPIQ